MAEKKSELKFVIDVDSRTGELKAQAFGAHLKKLGIDAEAAALKGRKGWQQYSQTLTMAGQKMKDFGKSMSMFVTLPIALMGAGALKAGGDFQMAMNQVQAVSGATGTELEQLRKQAKELGATTQFSASQAAEAMNFLAMAGFEANEILGAMPATLQLAASAQMDLGSAADIVSNVLAGYRLEVEDLNRVNDVLVKAFTSANTDLRQLGEAMKYAGPVAAAAGVEFEQSAAALALMGNAGIQASMAGTSLRGAISRMLNPSRQISSIMAEAGLNFRTAEGALRPLDEIIRQLEPHANDAGLMMKLFGQRAGPAMAVLVSQGADKLSEFTQKLRDSGGTAQRVAEVQMKGFNGAMRELKSALEALLIAIAESGLLEFMTDFVKGLAAWVREMAAASPKTLAFITTIAALVAAIGPLVWILGSLVGAAGALIPVISTVVGVLTGAGGFIVAAGASILALNPLVLAIAGLSIVLIAFSDDIADAIVGFLEWIGVCESAETQMNSINKVSEDAVTRFNVWAEAVGISADQMENWVKQGEKYGITMAKVRRGLIDYRDEIDRLKEAVDLGYLSQDKYNLILQSLIASSMSAEDKSQMLAKVFEKIEVAANAAATGGPGGGGGVGGLDDATRGMLDAFNEALRPADELNAELEALLPHVDIADIMRVYRDKIIEMAEAHIALNGPGSLPKTIEALYNLAQGIEVVNGAVVRIPQLTPEDLGYKELAEGGKLLATIEGNIAANIDKANEAAALAEVKRRAAAITTQQQADAVRDSEQALSDEADAQIRAATAGAQFNNVLKDQVSTIVTDLGKALTDITMKWEFTWQSLWDIAKSFMSSILRMFIESFTKPIMAGIAGIFTGQGFGAGFEGAGGFGGIAGIFGGLTGLFGGGGGFREVPGVGTGAGIAGMAGMGTTALGSMATGFKTIGANAVAAGKAIWSFLGYSTALGPLGAVIGGVAAGVFGLYTWLKKSTEEKLVDEFARDFGGISTSEDMWKSFVRTLGLTMDVAKDIRKDLSSSPIFLRMSYDLAEAQGKTSQFLASLEKVQTAWGTFNFRTAFEEGLATGDWTALNKAFTDAFSSSQRLADAFNNDLSPLLIEVDENVAHANATTKQFVGALEELRGKPAAVKADLDTMIIGLQALKDAGATDSEILQIVGADIITLVEAAREMNVEIPEAVMHFYELAGAADATSPALTKFNEAMSKGASSALDLLDSGEMFASQVYGFAQALLDAGIPAGQTQQITWDEMGDTALRLYNRLVQLGLPIPNLLQQMVEWAAAEGYIALEGNKAVATTYDLTNAVYGLNDAMMSGMQQWDNVIGKAVDLGDTIYGFALAAMEDLGISMQDTDRILELQLFTWDQFKSQILSTANAIIQSPLGVEGLPPMIKLILDWAEAQGLVNQQLDGTYQLTNAMNEAISSNISLLQEQKEAYRESAGAGGGTVPSEFDASMVVLRRMLIEAVPGIGVSEKISLPQILRNAFQAFENSGLGNLAAFEQMVLGPVLSMMQEGKSFRDAFLEATGIPSFQQGIRSVPRDMVAFVHRGERIMTAEENRAGAGKTIIIQTDVHIEGPVYGFDDLDRQVAAAWNRQFRRGAFREQIKE